MNQIVLLVILNAAIGFILKIFLVVRPIYTIYHQIKILTNSNLLENPDDLIGVRTCVKNPICSTIDTIGRNFFLVNMTIPFFFFHKFDRRFKECFEILIENMKKRLMKIRIFQIIFDLFFVKKQEVKQINCKEKD